MEVVAVLPQCEDFFMRESRTKVRGSKTMDGVSQPDLAQDTLQSVPGHVHGPLASVGDIRSCVNDAFENEFGILPACFLSKLDFVNGYR